MPPHRETEGERERVREGVKETERESRSVRGTCYTRSWKQIAWLNVIVTLRVNSLKKGLCPRIGLGAVSCARSAKAWHGCQTHVIVGRERSTDTPLS